MNGDYVAYTKEFVKKRSPLRTTIGGEDILLSYDDRHDIVSAFYADGNVTEVDALGFTADGGRLRRIEPLVSEIFWMIWLEFFPKTDVDSE